MYLNSIDFALCTVFSAIIMYGTATYTKVAFIIYVNGNAPLSRKLDQTVFDRGS